MPTRREFLAGAGGAFGGAAFEKGAEKSYKYLFSPDYESESDAELAKLAEKLSISKNDFIILMKSVASTEGELIFTKNDERCILSFNQGAISVRMEHFTVKPQVQKY